MHLDLDVISRFVSFISAFSVPTAADLLSTINTMFSGQIHQPIRYVHSCLIKTITNNPMKHPVEDSLFASAKAVVCYIIKILENILLMML